MQWDRHVEGQDDANGHAQLIGCAIEISAGCQVVGTAEAQMLSHAARRRAGNGPCRLHQCGWGVGGERATRRIVRPEKAVLRVEQVAYDTCQTRCCRTHWVAVFGLGR